jgi:nucleoside-diphosphate-sugar epimerase
MAPEAAKRAAETLHLLGVGHELLGERSGRRALARAVEERRTDALFQAVEAPAHGRHIEPQASRGPRQRALARDREEEANLLPVEGRPWGMHAFGRALRHQTILSLVLHVRNATWQRPKSQCVSARRMVSAVRRSIAMNSTQLHLVLGAGQVGPLVAERLLARGHRVRIARRTATPSRVPGVENISIDVRDADAVAQAAEGATVVYHCVNPLYDQWAELLMPITRGIVDGTARAGAKLVVLDNLYMYGDTAHMNEAAPMAPVSRKGALRVQAAECILEADARGAVPVAIGRAPDFFGPEAALSSVILGDRFFRRVFAGKKAQVFGDPDQRHAYAYTPDVAAGMVALGLSDGAQAEAEGRRRVHAEEGDVRLRVAQVEVPPLGEPLLVLVVLEGVGVGGVVGQGRRGGRRAGRCRPG